MASYQDIDTRLRVVEDKIDLVMKSFQVSKRYEHPLVPGQMIIETKSLLDIYRELRHIGAEVENNPPSSIIEGTATPVTEVETNDGTN